MVDLPEFTVAALEREEPFDVPGFHADDAVALGVMTVQVITEQHLNLAVRIVLRDDIVFQAKLGASGRRADEWLPKKAAVAQRFGESSLLVRLRHDEAGTPFGDRDDVDHDALAAYGGAVPLRVAGELVGTLTTSGEADVVDHAVAVEAIRRYFSARSFATS